MAKVRPELPRTDDPREIEEYRRELADFFGDDESISWDSVDKTGSNITEITTRDHNDLQNRNSGTPHDHTVLDNIGTNTHAQIDSAITDSEDHIAATAAHGATGAVVGTTNSQALTNKSLGTGTDLTSDLKHTGTKIGLFGTAPVAQTAAYSITNVTPDRAYDANTVAIAELADVVGTLIADLKSYGVLQ